MIFPYHEHQTGYYVFSITIIFYDLLCGKKLTINLATSFLIKKKILDYINFPFS